MQQRHSHPGTPSGALGEATTDGAKGDIFLQKATKSYILTRETERIQSFQ